MKQGIIFAQFVGQSASIQTSSAMTVSEGEPGLYSDKTGVKFDDFKVFPGWRRDSLVPRIGGVVDASISGGALSVTGTTRGGEAVVSGFEDDYYMVAADVAITGNAQPHRRHRARSGQAAGVLRRHRAPHRPLHGRTVPPGAQGGLPAEAGGAGGHTELFQTSTI